MTTDNRQLDMPKFHLIFLADNLDEMKQNSSEIFTRLRTLDNSMDTFTDRHLFTNYFFDHADERIILIIRGSIGKELIPIIHESPQLSSVYVIGTNKSYHQQWTKNCSKIKGVYSRLDSLCSKIEQTMQPTPRGRSTTPESSRLTVREKERRGRSAASSRADNTSTSIHPQIQDDLERTLIATTERTLRQSLSVNQKQPTVDSQTMNQIQDTLMRTIRQHTSTKNVDADLLNRLFADLKQSLIDSLVQHQPPPQPVLTEEMVKETVLNIIKEQNKVIATTPAHLRPTTILVNREVKIAANRKQTRIDADFRQKRDAIVNNQQLRDLVQQWSNVSSMSDLALLIKKHGKNPFEHAWLLFCWIAENIQYEIGCNINSADNVFRRRQGVCRGFVSLYHECCKLLDIECTEISGYAKSSFLKPGESLQNSAHAWNSIILDKYSYLVDTTWGAGGRGNSNKKCLEDFYFLTSPEELIYTHYCSGGQLLEPEISKQEFLSLPIMKSTYYQLGLRLISPKQGFNETNQNLFQISIHTPNNVNLLLQLKVNETEYPGCLHTLCQRDENQSDILNCFLAPPVAGLYQINIFANVNNEKQYRDAIEMRLRVPNIADAMTFPRFYAAFSQHKCILVEPLQRLVYRNSEILIHMIIPLANVVKIKNGEDFISLIQDDYKNGILKKKLRVQGDVCIHARWNDNADKIDTLCVFDLF